MPPPAQRLEGPSLPPDVRDLPAPPARLFLHGRAPQGPRVAIVGTRRPTAEAAAYAEQLARRLALCGVAVLSGGAKGIDASAHRGALGASGATLVVAASSFDRPYPEEHRALFEEIVAAGGGYLSRFSSGVEARRHRFLERNALLVALCHALVVVEAPLRSGARNAAAWARRLRRPCFVVPSAPWNERGRGCIAELQRGAIPLALPEEVLRWLDDNVRRLPVEPAGEAEPVAAGSASRRRSARPTAQPSAAQPSAAQRAAAEDDDATRTAILRELASGPRYLEQLADGVASATLAELNHAVLSLLLSGSIRRAPDGALTRAPR